VVGVGGGWVVGGGVVVVVVVVVMQCNSFLFTCWLKIQKASSRTILSLFENKKIRHYEKLKILCIFVNVVFLDN
jgi:hypothetical protein